MSEVNSINDSKLNKYQCSDFKGAVDYFGRQVSQKIYSGIDTVSFCAKMCFKFVAYYFNKLFSARGLPYRSGGADRFYQSPAVNKLRQSYYAWLVDKLKQPEYKDLFPNDLIEGLSKVQEKGFPDLADARSSKRFYQETLTKQRKSIEKLLSKGSSLNDKQTRMLNFFKEWAHWRLREVELLPEIQEFTKNKGWVSQVSCPQNLREWRGHLQRTDSSLRWDSTLGESGSMKDLYDPHLFGNTPYKAYDLTLKSGKQCRVMRIPTVTRDTKLFAGKTSETNVIEEFEVFSKALQDKGEKHLYVNLMQRKGRLNEVPRSLALEGMDKRSGFPVSVLSLDKNSAFYTQSGLDFRGSKSVQEFKKDYKKHLLNSECYYWPSELTKEQLESLLDKTIDTVTEKYFSGKINLDRQARRDLIELHYSEIISKIANDLDVDSMNASCKDCIDRGASQLFELWIKEMQGSGKVYSAEEVNRMTNLLFARVLLSSRHIFQCDLFAGDG